MSVDMVESIKSCFGKESVQNVRIEGDKIFIAITEDNNWWRNKCVLQDWYFDYEKFKTLNMHIDCESYGVYVFWPREDEEEEEGVHGDERLDKWVHEHYGEECDWVLLDSLDDDQEVVERLPDFIVLDDDNNKLKGIAIINKDDEDDDEEENMPLVEGVDYEVLDD